MLTFIVTSFTVAKERQTNSHLHDKVEYSRDSIWPLCHSLTLDRNVCIHQHNYGKNIKIVYEKVMIC